MLHADEQDDREFLTLDEGLKKGVVNVTEKENPTVGELVIENQSDLHLFLQEGDRLYGGKQDRIIYASIVIPPKSGKMTVPAFCIEPARWSPGRQGMQFSATDNTALAPRQVRNAAKLARNQQQVWENVRQIQVAFSNSHRETTNTSSLNEVLKHTAVVKPSEEYATALKKVLADKPDVVGVAFAVNGQIEEVNIYPNHWLLCRMYPRLIQSYVPQAVFQRTEGWTPKPPTCEEVVKLLTQGKAHSTRSEPINQDNHLEIVNLEVEGRPEVIAFCTTQYRGKSVHLQYVRNEPQNRGVGRPYDNDANAVPTRAQQRLP